MANVTVKLFGVLRMDTHLASETLNIEKVGDLFDSINRTIDERYEKNHAENPALEKPEKLAFKHVVLFVNGERCTRKGHKLTDGDEIWVLSPASGG